MAENAQVQEINTKNTNDQNEEEGNYLKINTKSEFDIYNEEESSKKLNVQKTIAKIYNRF